MTETASSGLRVAVAQRSGVISVRPLEQLRPQRPGGRGHRLWSATPDPVVATTVMQPGESIVATTSHGRSVEVKIGPEPIDESEQRVVCRLGGLFADEELVSVDRPSTEPDERTLLVTRMGKGIWIQRRLLERPKEEGPAIQFDPSDRVVQSLRVRTDDVVVLATARGLVKSIDQTSIPSRSSGAVGVRLITLHGDDYLVAACRSDDPSDSVVLIGSNGNIGRFHRSEARPMGRDAVGVVGLRLAGPREALIGVHAAAVQDHILMFSISGRTLRLPMAFTRPKHRGGFGVPVFAIESNDIVTASCVVPG